MILAIVGCLFATLATRTRAKPCSRRYKGKLMNIYGNHIDLETPDDDAIIVDVVVIARSLRTGKDGRMEDAVLVSSTDSTTGIIFDGMLSAVANGEYVEVDDD